MFGNSFLVLMGAVVYLGCIIILSIAFQFLPKSLPKHKFILTSALLLTTPFLILLLIIRPPQNDALFFYSMTILYSLLNGIYGALYFRFFRSKKIEN